MGKKRLPGGNIDGGAATDLDRELFENKVTDTR
jgi:hypothetical protein